MLLSKKYKQPDRIFLVAVSFFCASFAALVLAEPLRIDFTPIEVQSTTATNTGATVVTDFYAQTESYADLYAREQVHFTKPEVVSIAADLIGTPYDGLTCAQLLDVFEEPCAIPPQYPQPDNPPEYDASGFCATAQSPFTSASESFVSCYNRVKAFANGSIYKDARGGPCELTTSGSNVYGVGKRRVQLLATRVSDNVPVVIARWFDPAAGTCTLPDYEEPIPDPTEEEVFEVIKPAITNNYFTNHYTGQPISHSNFSSTSTTITNTYNSYYSSGPGASSPQTVPPGVSPIPAPPLPTPDPVPSNEESPQDDPDFYNCASLPGGCGANIGGGSFGDTEMDARILAKKNELIAYFNGIKDDAQAYWDFSLDNGSQLPCESFEIWGTVHEICLDEYTAELSMIGTFVIFMSYLIGTLMIMRR